MPLVLHGSSGVPDHVIVAAIRAGMVADFHFFVVPKVVGGGISALPDGVSLDLRLAERRLFGDTVYLHYRPAEGGGA